MTSLLQVKHAATVYITSFPAQFLIFIFSFSAHQKKSNDLFCFCFFSQYSHAIRLLTAARVRVVRRTLWHAVRPSACQSLSHVARCSSVRLSESVTRRHCCGSGYGTLFVRPPVRVCHT